MQLRRQKRDLDQGEQQMQMQSLCQFTLPLQPCRAIVGHQNSCIARGQSLALCKIPHGHQVVVHGCVNVMLCQVKCKSAYSVFTFVLDNQKSTLLNIQCHVKYAYSVMIFTFIFFLIIEKLHFKHMLPFKMFLLCIILILDIRKVQL